MLHKMTSNLRSSCFSLPNIWEGPVLFRVSIPFITHHDQMGGQRFISAYSSTEHPITEESQGRNSDRAGA